jgi:hypothetical protein
MDINTGYCDVGNFGSEDRMEYTIIGAEANLAARFQSIVEWPNRGPEGPPMRRLVGGGQSGIRG